MMVHIQSNPLPISPTIYVLRVRHYPVFVPRKHSGHRRIGTHTEPHAWLRINCD